MTLTFRSLTTAQGLAHPTVRSILQDRRGFMWFGTNRGLNRYEGYHFMSFASDPDAPSSLGSAVISALAEDRDGMLWVGTVGAGLATYDPRTGRSTSVQYDLRDITRPSRTNVWSLLVDRGGALWVGTGGAGLSRRDPASGQFTNYRHDPADPASLSSNTVMAILEDRDGALWIGTLDGGLDRFDPASGRFTHYRHDPADPASLSSDRVETVYEDRAGTLWIGTLGGGLNRFDRRTGQFTHYRHHPAGAGSLSNDNVSAIHQDRTGTLWIGTLGGGLNRFDPATGVFAACRHSPDDPLSLQADSIWALYEDTSGLLWIGTDGGGISFAKLYNWPFQRYMNQIAEQNSLARGTVRGMAAGADGTVWIGTFGGGLNRFDPRNQRFMHYRHDSSDPHSLSDDLIWAVYVDRAGVPWIGTDGGYLNRFDRASGTFTRYRLGTAAGYPIRAISQDRSGAIWIGSDGGGLSRFDPRTAAVTTYRHDPNDPHSLSYDSIQSVYEDPEGALWVGTFGGGLNRFDRATGVFTAYRHDPADPRSLSHDIVTDLYEDQHGTLWVGTGSGLNRFDRATGSFTRYTTAQRLLDNLVDGIIEVDGALWISTLHGLSRLDPQSSTFRNYDTIDTQLSDGFTVNSLTRTGDGTIYAGGFGGFVAFKPALARDEPFIPPVAFTDFRIDNQPVAIGDNSVLHQAIDATESLTLPRGKRSFGIEFAALEYWLPDRNRYRYMLEGVDKGWVEVDSQRRYISYTNLAPGTYVLRVTNANGDGYWSKQVRTLTITIPPFWWETVWFFLAVVVLTGVITLGSIRFRFHRLRMNQRRLTKLVADRTSELSEQTRALERSNAQLTRQIGERERAEAERVQSHQELATLLSASQQLVVAIDVDLQPDRILEQLERVVSYNAAVIGTLDGDTLVIRAARGCARDVQGLSFDVTTIPPVAALIAKRAPMLVADVQSEASTLAFVEAVCAEPKPGHSLVGVPLVVSDRVIGVLYILHNEVNFFTDRDQQRVQIFANLAATAIENARLSELALASAVLEERSRIARDLHDAVSQTLFSASLIAEGLRNAHNLPPAKERQGLEDLRQLTRGALAEMRALLYELHPGGLVEKPLGHLLDSLCTAFTSRTRIPVALAVTGPDRLEPQVQEMLYRIAQEALNNISKHAAASAARVALTCSAEEVVLVIADDGRGFEVADRSHTSLGIGIMRERAAKIGAQLRIESHLGAGTTVTVVWRAADPHPIVHSDGS